LRKPSIRLALMLAKIAITLAVFVFIARIVHLDRLWSCIKATDPLSLFAAVAVTLAQMPLVGVRWWSIIERITKHGDPVPQMSRVQQINWISQFFAQVLPFVAGDATRILLLRNAGATLRVAIKSALLDRAIALVVILVLALPAVLLSPIIGSASAYTAPIRLLVVTGLIGSLGALMVAPWLPNALAGSRLAPIAEILVDLRRVTFDRRALAPIAGICVVVHSMSMLVFWLLAKGQGLPIGFGDAAAIVPLLVLVATIPIAIAGWGVREAFLLTLMAATGVSSEQALLLSISFGFVPLIASLPGAAALAFVGRTSASQAQFAEPLVKA
jgi:glycosyltransferase 2 family protein